MNLISIDTSSVACSVALQTGHGVAERHEEQEREHTRLLMPMIRELLAAAGLTPSQLDAVVLGNGPGSFIGMRIAASVAQGLAHGANIEILPVSSLAAVAAQVFAESAADEVLVAQDAHMNEVYLGAFRRDAADLPVALFPERLQTQTPVEGLDAARVPGRVAAGFGWERYPALLAANADRVGSRSVLQYPRARFLLPLGAAAMAGGMAIRPQDLAPAYLRSKVAQKPVPG
ncbi:MAG: tRNA (adenosine(37)-N6)-threonylcarbamoyltransferase complex dimerization subunit type 1 TsaB [Gammaproteobacteria bacterium]|nr:tRNA (adenosine(37)-N6)-threonylcarbamoyltransferase complex dimerization subunit type 1 TsaB [Gammaproteobacteria bacterium]MDH5620243.1 tRNA (adenosine(37)-N6)-threonylcarbamoyltransferase complex dimerization subunit type 1 TsaB [Gammaproteobacteria bacterium]